MVEVEVFLEEGEVIGSGKTDCGVESGDTAVESHRKEPSQLVDASVLLESKGLPVLSRQE